MLHRKLKVALATLIWTLGFVTSATAGINTFTPLGPEGGTVNKVAFHPTNGAIAYLATMSGFYRSTDSGLSWRKSGGVPPLLTYDFAVDPNNGDRIFVAAINTGVLVSTDAGATLNRVTTFPLGFFGPFNVEMSRDGTLYVASDTRIFCSTDGGATWQERTSPSGNILVGTLRVDPLDGNTLYAFASSTGSRSTDGGMSWQPLVFPAPISDLIIAPVTPRLIFAAASTSGVLVSSNGGASWASAGLSDLAFTIAIDPTNASVLYAGTMPSGLFRTTNQGGSWTNVHGNARSGEVSTIAINPLQPSVILLGGDEGLSRSTTSGASWQTVNSGFIAHTIHGIVPLPASNRTYFLSYRSGIFALDHGATSARPVNPAGLDAMTNKIGIESFNLHAQGLASDRLFVGMNGGFARSDDGGDHWQFIATSIAGLASHPSQPGIVIGSAYRDGVRRSIDGAVTWGPVTGLPNLGAAWPIAFAPNSPAVVYAGISRWEPPPSDSYVPEGIYKSTDGGASWIAVNNGSPQTGVLDLAVDPRTELTLYAATQAGLFKSVNGGTSWTALNWNLGASSGLITRVMVDTLQPDTIYAIQSANIGRSIDGGNTWENLSKQVAGNTGTEAIAADPFRKHTIFAGSYYEGALEMTIGTDVEIEAALPTGPVPYGSAPTSYTYTVRNLGPFHATALRTAIQLPASARNISASTTGGTCVVQGANVTCTQPAMLAGRATQITINSSNPTAGDVEVLAQAQSSEPDTQTSNNSVRNVVHVAAISDLSVASSAPATITEGSNITYSIMVANAGPDEATAVTSSIQLPAGLSVASVAASRGSCTANTAGFVSCTVGNLASAANANITIATGLVSPGTYLATAIVNASGFDPALANNTTSISTSVSAMNSSSSSSTSSSSSSTGSSSGSGGGGGGSASWLLLATLACLAYVRVQASGRRGVIVARKHNYFAR